jgi:predicted nucleotidyltransferase
MVPEMGTPFSTWSKVGAALFGKTRRRLLALLFGQPERAFFLREIVRSTDVGQGAVQRELANLVEAGLVQREKRGNQVFFQANAEAPAFADLRALVLKTCGVGAVVQSALTDLGSSIEVAFLYGSIVTGEERPDSDIDVLVVGDAAFGDVVDALGRIEEKVGRPINPTVYRRSEFRKRLASKNHFLTQVMKAPKEVVIGDLDDLAAVG